MSLSPDSKPLALHELLMRWRPSLAATVVLYTVIALAVILQISLLSGWHLPLISPNIDALPASASVTANPSKASLNYVLTTSPAVAVTKPIDINTQSIMGVTLTMSTVPEKTTLTLGWRGSADQRRANNYAVQLAASSTPKTIYVPLRGHRDWNGNVRQFAIALSSAASNTNVEVTNHEFVSATPIGALKHAWHRWFTGDIESASAKLSERVLPLSALVGLITLLAFFTVAVWKRANPQARRSAIIDTFIILSTLALIISVASRTAYQLNNATIPWLCAALSFAVALFGRTLTMSLPIPKDIVSDIVAVLLACVSVTLGGWSFAWIVAPLVAAIVSQRYPNFYRRLQPIVFFAPPLALGAIAQGIAMKRIQLPGTAVRDPSSLLANWAEQSATLAALLLAIGLAAWALPHSARRMRDVAAGSVLWLVALGILATLALAPASEIVSSSTGAAWMLLPLGVAMLAWLAPPFITPIDAVVNTDHNAAKTEHDLSDVVRQLFDGAANSFESAVNSERVGSALAPLNRMKEIAPGSLITKAAEVNYALRGTQLAQARAAYETLRATPKQALSEPMQGLVLAYANRINDYPVVIERASALPPSPESCHLHARALLLSASSETANAARLEAIEVLGACPKPNELSHQIAELHLLADDVQAAQQALAASSIALESLPGQVYLARLGLIATGSTSYADQIKKLVTWHADLTVAQVAMGEVLLREGNVAGARARFALAVKNDLTLWPLQRRIQDIDTALAQHAMNSPPPPLTNTQHA